MLYDLMGERRKPGYNYAWFVSVALQRMWGISPKALKEKREQFALIRSSNAPQKIHAGTGEIKSAIAQAAARKAMR